MSSARATDGATTGDSPDGPGERLREELQPLPPRAPRQSAQVDADQYRDIEHDELERVLIALRPEQGGHRPLEPSGDQLAVEDGPVVEDRQSSAESA